MGTTEITAAAGTPFIDIVREVKAPRELVYRAHTDPNLIVKWLGPRRFRMTVERWEPVDGGAWHFTHHDTDGSAFGFHGVFHGTPSADGMLQTFEFEGAPGHVSLDKLTLEDQGDRTIVRIHSVYQSVEARDAMVENGMGSGVSEGYDRLDELVAGDAARVGALA